MRTLYTLIDSTYVIRIVKLISFMLMNNIDMNISSVVPLQDIVSSTIYYERSK